MQLTDNVPRTRGVTEGTVWGPVDRQHEFHSRAKGESGLFGCSLVPRLPQLFVAYSKKKLGKPGNEARLRVSLVCLAVSSTDHELPWIAGQMLPTCTSVTTRLRLPSCNSGARVHSWANGNSALFRLAVEL